MQLKKSRNVSKSALLIGLLLMALLMFLGKDKLLSYIFKAGVRVEPKAVFVEEPVVVKMSTLLNGEIYYTEDGSEPNVEAKKYLGPIKIEESVVIKTAVFNEEKRASKITIKELVVGDKHEVAVMFLTTEPESLWDEETGIYVEGKHDNYNQRGKDWEREGEVAFYETDGDLGFRQKVGIRINGGNMRSLPQKSFRLYMKDEDGKDSWLSYRLFGEEGNLNHQSVVLRNGGGDSSLSMLRDCVANKIVRSSSELEAMSCRPVAVYLNGKYWGLYWLNNRFDEQYFEEKYQINTDLLSILETPLASGDDRGEVIEYFDKSKQDDEVFNDILAEVRRCRDCVGYLKLNEQIDVSSFIDYILFEFYFANKDWPFNNNRVWRYRAEAEAPLDNRFRWILFDLDASMAAGAVTIVEGQSAATENPYERLIDDAFPLRNFLYDRAFKEKFYLRLTQLLESELAPENTDKVVEELAMQIEEEMPRQLTRWGGEFEGWKTNVEIIKAFLRSRPEKFEEHTLNFNKTK